jgi:hypothetical protein
MVCPIWQSTILVRLSSAFGMYSAVDSLNVEHLNIFSRSVRPVNHAREYVNHFQENHFHHSKVELAAESREKTRRCHVDVIRKLVTCESFVQGLLIQRLPNLIYLTITGLIFQGTWFHLILSSRLFVPTPRF